MTTFRDVLVTLVVIITGLAGLFMIPILGAAIFVIGIFICVYVLVKDLREHGEEENGKHRE